MIQKKKKESQIELKQAFTCFVQVPVSTKEWVYYLAWQPGHSTMSWSMRNRNHYIVQNPTLWLREKNQINLIIMALWWSNKPISHRFL